MTGMAAAWYAHGDLVVLRAALAPRDQWPCGDSREPDDPGRLSDLCRAFRADHGLAAALELASPDLARAAGRPADEIAAMRPADRRRMTVALCGYLLRSRHRATPSGLFAGTAVIPVQAGQPGRIGTGHRLLLRPAPCWLADLAAVLEADPALAAKAPKVRIATAPQLRFAGPLRLLAGDRAGEPGRWQPRRVVTGAALTDAMLGLAATWRCGRTGIGYRELLDLLCSAVPGAAAGQLAGLAGQLLAAQFLVTDLLPEPGEVDPLGHLVRRLRGHPVAGPLRGLRRELRRPAWPPSAHRLRRLRARMEAVHKGGSGLVADTLLDTDLRLPPQVADEVSRAASVAWACNPAQPDRQPRGLHLAMLDRYGPGCAVPLAELLGFASSLGLAATAGPGPAAPAEVPGVARDRLLSRLALDALQAGHAELVLTRTVRHQIASLTPPAGQPPSADVFAEVITASADALHAGQFVVVLGSQSSPGPAGSSAGRLAAALGSERTLALAEHPVGCRAGTADAEVIFRPPDAEAMNLLSRTGWAPYRIDLTAHRSGSPADIAVDDLHVICEPDRLRLHCAPLRTDIRPVSWSALHPARADPVARLLLALGRDGRTPWLAWTWGAARTLPWLPRVRAGRAILAPARWLLPPDIVHLAEVGTERQWRLRLARWRDADGLPEVVFAGAWDRRLPLDLGDPVHAALLRKEVRDHGTGHVTEPPGGLAAWRAAGWPRGQDGVHAAQIAVPLYPRPLPPAGPAPRRPADPGQQAPGRRPAEPGQRALRLSGGPAAVLMPGGSWLCASLLAPAELQDGVLAGLAGADLLRSAGRAGVDRWFFARTAGQDGLPRLVFRFHGPPSELNLVLLPAVRDWGTRLSADGLIGDLSLVSYRPELSRYGGACCMAAAERVFHHDSMRCLRLLAGRAPGPLAGLWQAADAALHLLMVMLGSARAVAWLPRPRLSAAESRLLTRLRADPPGEAGQAGRSAEAPEAPDWQDLRVTLAAYRSQLIGTGLDPAPIATSLVHMCCNRLLGPSRPAERVAVALARDLAATHLATGRWPAGSLPSTDLADQ